MKTQLITKILFSVLSGFLVPLNCFELTETKAKGSFQAVCDERCRQLYRATVRHIESGGIGYQDGYTTLETFFLSNRDWTVAPFLDARAHLFNNGKWAANVGVGMRGAWKERVYGLNAYYDYRNGGRLHAHQIGIGIETLGTCFDFRLNGYLPCGTKTSAPYSASFSSFSGHHMLISQKYLSAMRGVDLECGFHLRTTDLFDLYLAAGPYYFIGEIAPVTWGGKARIRAVFKEMLSLEISNSYDRTFRNKFQGQIGFNFAFGPCSTLKQKATCGKISDRMLQLVNRQEIIVMDHATKKTVAFDPMTGLPYFFIFVDNTASSNGTYESPYHSFAQAQRVSSPNDIIYVFPGDGTTSGMNAGILLKANQKLWGSGISHLLQTAQGMITIPSQSSSSPVITNIDVDTEGNAVTLATNNWVSGLTIRSALNDAIYGTNVQSLQVSSCVIEGTTTFPIEASFSTDGSISIANNQFSNNVNGIQLSLTGGSTITCSNNLFEGQTSVSNFPVEISAANNSFVLQIDNNRFNDNRTGGIFCSLDRVIDADVTLVNNSITNSSTGFVSALGSSFVIISTDTIDQCAITMENNTFAANTSHALYMHSSGQMRTVDIRASNNIFSNNGGSALVMVTPVTESLAIVAINNTLTGLNDNGIAVIASGSTSLGSIQISNNLIENIGNTSNGIAINQDFSILNFTALNNQIDGCEGTGILSYAPTGIGSFSANISGNAIRNCENFAANAASGIDIEQYIHLQALLSNNVLSDNTSAAVALSSTLTAPTACVTLSGNQNSLNYLLVNPVDGLFNLSPCNVDEVNTGIINTTGIISSVQSCSDPEPCP